MSDASREWNMYRWVLILGALLALAGIAFGSPSLIVPGIALVGIAAVAFVWVEASARGAVVEVESGPSRIVEGDAYPLHGRIRHGYLPPPGGEIRHPLLPRPIRSGTFRPSRVELEIRMPRRGKHVLDGAAWRLLDPLGLHAREVPAPPGGELLVLPRLEPVSVMGPASVEGGGVGAARGGEEGAASIREARAVEFEVDGLRPYREGSPASRIHWPAVARSGEMHERRILAGAEATPLVALDAEDPADLEALDRAVRAAASLCVHLAPGVGCGVLLPGSRAPAMLDAHLRAWPALHARFAVVGSGAPTRLPSRAAGLRGSVFWVTARTPGSQSVPRMAGAGKHYLVSAFELRGPPSFEVAGCFGSLTSGRAAARARAAA
ncbi:MAG TPA: DUF58 domain-containing protein [Solirubrobacterales bacterium]|nr:DUF58 domain-containing protein [Solirubrobacterales bacterium]